MSDTRVNTCVIKTGMTFPCPNCGKLIATIEPLSEDEAVLFEAGEAITHHITCGLCGFVQITRDTNTSGPMEVWYADQNLIDQSNQLYVKSRRN